MQKFTQKIVQMMKDEKLFESQGGPIILSQVWYFLVNFYLLCSGFLMTVNLQKHDGQFQFDSYK